MLLKRKSYHAGSPGVCRVLNRMLVQIHIKRQTWKILFVGFYFVRLIPGSFLMKLKARDLRAFTGSKH